MIIDFRNRGGGGGGTVVGGLKKVDITSDLEEILNGQDFPEPGEELEYELTTAQYNALRAKMTGDVIIYLYNAPVGYVLNDTDIQVFDYAIAYDFELPTNRLLISNLDTFGLFVRGEGSQSIMQSPDDTAISPYDISLGHLNTVQGNHSFAQGYKNIITAAHCLAVGNETEANAQYATARGRRSKANGEYSVAFGKNTVVNNLGETSFGCYNTSSNDTLFSLGNGTSDTVRANAFEVKQNGDVYFQENGSPVKLQDKFATMLKGRMLTQAQYDALTNKDNDTLYIITD